MLGQATSKLSKMHARRNPNLSIQSTANYSQLSPPPQSATSGAFLSPTVASRRGLLARSPPASPSLPSLVPRHGKKPPQSSHSNLVKKILIGCCGVAFLLWLILRQVYSDSQQAMSYVDDSEEWEMVGGEQLPKEPSALAVQDAQGKMRWTVHVPSSQEFPLRPAQYRDICQQSMELASSIRQETQSTNNVKRMLNYYQQDQYFIDVQDAEQQGLLPHSKDTGRPKSFVEDESIVDGFSTSGLKICDKSMTYVMEAEDAGFGNTLMRLWMSYGLAKAEKRAFFIDDTRWPYGKFSSYFMPPPTAGCMPPPKSHIVPCPHTAKHIVVSEATVKYTFGHAFNEEYEDPRKMRTERQHKIFALIRTGYDALFKLKGDDAKYVTSRTQEIYGDIKKHGGISLGIHVRHGDKHPMEYQYQKDYIPLTRYVETARDIYIDLIESKQSKLKNRNPESSSSPELFARHTPSRMILASDDPLVYESPELGQSSLRAQDRIVLATKQALEAASGKKNPWIDEITGWEGGFYRDVFFSLGQAGNNAASSNDPNSPKPNNNPSSPNPNSNGNKDVQPSQQAMSLRELVGRAYLLDLAVLGQADTIVCTVSSTSCRLLAVMLGWDAMVGKESERRWRSIDGSFDWKGIMW